MTQTGMPVSPMRPNNNDNFWLVTTFRSKLFNLYEFALIIEPLYASVLLITYDTKSTSELLCNAMKVMSS